MKTIKSSNYVAVSGGSGGGLTTNQINSLIDAKVNPVIAKNDDQDSIIHDRKVTDKGLELQIELVDGANWVSLGTPSEVKPISHIGTTRVAVSIDAPTSNGVALSVPISPSAYPAGTTLWVKADGGNSRIQYTTPIGGLTATEVQNLIDNAGYAQDRNINVQAGILAADDRLRSFVTTESNTRRWFKIAELTIPGTFKGFHLHYSISSRQVQSQGDVRITSLSSPATIQFLRAKTGVGATQLVLMREDANPESYHLLLKVVSFNRHFAMAQRVLASGIHAGMTYAVDYVNTGLTGDGTTTETVTGYTGYTQIGSLTV